MEPYEVSEVSENTNPDVTLNAATTEAQNTTDSATVTEPEANEKTTEDVAAASACAMTKEEILEKSRSENAGKDSGRAGTGCRRSG